MFGVAEAAGAEISIPLMALALLGVTRHCRATGYSIAINRDASPSLLKQRQYKASVRHLVGTNTQCEANILL